MEEGRGIDEVGGGGGGENSILVSWRYIHGGTRESLHWDGHAVSRLQWML